MVAMIDHVNIFIVKYKRFPRRRFHKREALGSVSYISRTRRVRYWSYVPMSPDVDKRLSKNLSTCQPLEPKIPCSKSIATHMGTLKNTIFVNGMTE